MQQGHPQNIVRTPVLTTVKGNIVQQIPIQQAQQQQLQQQPQQQQPQQAPQQPTQQTIMHSPSQLINATIVPNSGGSVTVWQRRPDQSKKFVEFCECFGSAVEDRASARLPRSGNV